MKIAPISYGQNLNFNGLFIDDSQKYSKEQEQVIKNIKDVVNQPNPYDKYGRSYIKYLDQKCNSDLFIKAGKDSSKIELSIKDQEFDESQELIGEYSLAKALQSTTLDAYTEFESLERRDFKSRFLNVVFLVTAILGFMYLGSRQKNAEAVVSNIKKEVVNGKTQKIAADTLDLSKQIIK